MQLRDRTVGLILQVQVQLGRGFHNAIPGEKHLLGDAGPNGLTRAATRHRRCCFPWKLFVGNDANGNCRRGRVVRPIRSICRVDWKCWSLKWRTFTTRRSCKRIGGGGRRSVWLFLIGYTVLDDALIGAIGSHIIGWRTDWFCYSVTPLQGNRVLAGWSGSFSGNHCG